MPRVPIISFLIKLFDVSMKKILKESAVSFFIASSQIEAKRWGFEEQLQGVKREKSWYVIK